MPEYQQIREICARLVTANNDEQMRATLTELKIALHDRPSTAEDPENSDQPQDFNTNRS